jgi:hypothetical protein
VSEPSVYRSLTSRFSATRHAPRTAVRTVHQALRFRQRPVCMPVAAQRWPLQRRPGSRESRHQRHTAEVLLKYSLPLSAPKCEYVCSSTRPRGQQEQRAASRQACSEQRANDSASVACCVVIKLSCSHTKRPAPTTTTRRTRAPHSPPALYNPHNAGVLINAPILVRGG